MSKLIGVLLLVVMVAAAVASGGCSSSGGTDPAELEGRWVLESFGGGDSLRAADPGVRSTLNLAKGQASGSGGANRFDGPYKADSDGKISFGPIAATKMAGPAAAMKQESEFIAAIEAAKRFEFNDGKLVLSDLGNNTLVVLVPE
jgi:heat shock protein HslJ